MFYLNLIWILSKCIVKLIHLYVWFIRHLCQWLLYSFENVDRFKSVIYICPFRTVRISLRKEVQQTKTVNINYKLIITL